MRVSELSNSVPHESDINLTALVKEMSFDRRDIYLTALEKAEQRQI